MSVHTLLKSTNSMPRSLFLCGSIYGKVKGRQSQPSLETEIRIVHALGVGKTRLKRKFLEKWQMLTLGGCELPLAVKPEAGALCL